MADPGRRGRLEMVRRAVWAMLYADDAVVVSTSPRGLTRTMDVIVVACQEFGLTVSEKKYRDHAPVVPSRYSVERAAN